MEVVEFDLANAIFAVGSPDDKNNIYRQFVGVPMGSPLSPSPAKLTCMYFENILFQKIKHDKTCKLEGLRFMDDLIAIGIYDYKSEDHKCTHPSTLEPSEQASATAVSAKPQ